MKIVKTKKGNYSVRFKTKSGKTVTRSLGTSDINEARKMVKESSIEQLEMAGKINALTRDAVISIIADENLTFQDCIRAWYEFSKVRSKSNNTIYTQSGLLSTFGANFKIKKISDLRSTDISDWVNEDTKIKANSRGQRLSAIRSLCSYALANGLMVKDPSYGVKVDLSKLDHNQKEKTQRVPFTQEEYEALLASDPPYFMRHAINLGWWTGLRISDISKLEWDSWSHSHLTVWTEKQDKRVNLPIGNPLIGGGELLDLVATITPNNSIYCFPEWAEYIGDPKKRSRFSVYFGRHLARTGITGKSFHCFRHSFVSRTNLSYDASLEKIASWVGHSSTETTRVYLH